MVARIISSPWLQQINCALIIWNTRPILCSHLSLFILCNLLLLRRVTWAFDVLTHKYTCQKSRKSRHGPDFDRSLGYLTCW